MREAGDEAFLSPTVGEGVSASCCAMDDTGDVVVLSNLVQDVVELSAVVVVASTTDEDKDVMVSCRTAAA